MDALQPQPAVMIISGNHDSGLRLKFASSFLEKHGIYIAATLPEREESSGGRRDEILGLAALINQELEELNDSIEKEIRLLGAREGEIRKELDAAETEAELELAARRVAEKIAPLPECL